MLGLAYNFNKSLYAPNLGTFSNGAGERNRTFNLLITSQLLYH